MLIPLSWLREYVDVVLTPEQLAERLTLLGMEVSSIERIGADWQRIVVGELLEVAPHPTSSKLSLTRVRTGEGGRELSGTHRPDLVLYNSVGVSSRPSLPLCQGNIAPTWPAARAAARASSRRR